jgi:hypothetical protein
MGFVDIKVAEKISDVIKSYYDKIRFDGDKK